MAALLPAVAVIQRTVYHAPTLGRSFFTKRAAYKAEARARYRAKLGDDLIDVDPDYFDRVTQRYARLLLRRDRNQQSPTVDWRPAQSMPEDHYA